ncbi:MAG: hypothetical protein ABR505_07980 [Actinomycetota bacterium]
MTPYQILLLAILVLWPLAIAGLLFLMSRLEQYVARPDAESPEEAGLEPVAGAAPEREVRIVFGDKVVGDQVEPALRESGS